MAVMVVAEAPAFSLGNLCILHQGPKESIPPPSNKCQGVAIFLTYNYLHIPQSIVLVFLPPEFVAQLRRQDWKIATFGISMPACVVKGSRERIPGFQTV